VGPIFIKTASASCEKLANHVLMRPHLPTSYDIGLNKTRTFLLLLSTA